MTQRTGEPSWPFGRRLGPVSRLLPWHKPQVRVAAVIGSDDKPLREWANWIELMPSLMALTRNLRHKATIRPWIYSNSGGKAASFRLLRFNEASNRRWIEALEGKEQYLDRLEIWSPARSGTVEQGTCPDLYIQLVSDGDFAEQGFILSIALNQLDSLAKPADAVLARLEALLAPARRLIADRAWEERRIGGLIRVNNLDDRGPPDALEWAQANESRQVASFAAR